VSQQEIPKTWASSMAGDRSTHLVGRRGHEDGDRSAQQASQTHHR
jgi:hypothetical protein